MYKFILSSLFFVFHLTHSFAQTDTFILKDALVTNNRLQRSVYPASILSKKQIAILPGFTLANFLALINGVDIRQRGPEGVQSDIGIRGGSFDQTLILLNGMKLSDPQTGHHMLNIPIINEAIDQIEVIKNGSSRIYGINALSGSVNVITKVPSKNMLYLSAFAGDFNLFGLKLGAVLNVKNIGQHFSYSQSQSSGYLPNTDFTQSHLFYQSSIKQKHSGLNLTLGYSDRRFGARGFYVSNSNEYESIQTVFSGLQHEFTKDNFKFKTQIYYRYNQDHYVYLRNQPSYYQNFHFTHAAGAEWHAVYKSKFGETGIGFDSRYEQLNSTNLGERNRTTLGVFLEHKLNFFNSKLSLTPGVYFTQISNYKQASFPGFDFNYKYSNRWAFFGSLDKGMRLPTYTDLYYKGPNNIGNSTLIPETAISSEIGLKFQNNKTFVSGSFFKRTSNNLIDWARSDSSQKWQPLNLNSIILKGFEANFNIVLKRFVKQIQLGYTFINGNTQPLNGVQSRYILMNLKQQFNSTIALKWHPKLTQTITYRFIDRLTMNQYAIVDGKLLYQLKTLDCFIESTNIFNIHYMEAGFVTMPGRWFKLGFNLKFNY